MTTAITDAELQVFQLLLAAAKDGRASLYRVAVNGEERAALVSLERKPGGGSTLGVFGLLLAPEEMQEISKSLSGQKIIEAPEDKVEKLDIVPVQMPPVDKLDRYVSVGHADYDLGDMLREHNAQVDASATDQVNPGTHFEVFANKDDGQTYLAASMVQLFRKTDAEIYRTEECPFCPGNPELNELEDGWRVCPTCSCEWAEDGRFRKGKG